jgi:ribokinase
MLGGEFAVHGGGKGANQAIAAARAGATVTMAACLGDDDFGAARLADLVREGIDVAGVRRLPGSASGVALIGVDASGQNSIMVASGANARATPALVEAVNLTAGDVLLMQLELPLPVVAAGLRAARRAGALAILNAAPMTAAAAELLPAVDLLIVNEVEAADLLGEPAAPIDATTPWRLAARGPRQVIVTLGERGVLAGDGERTTAVPALPVVAVDSTGAGDAFCGVLAAGLAAGADLATAVRHGVVAGGLAVTRAGAQSSLPSWDEIAAALPRLSGAS